MTPRLLKVLVALAIVPLWVATWMLAGGRAIERTGTEAAQEAGDPIFEVVQTTRAQGEVRRTHGERHRRARAAAAQAPLAASTRPSDPRPAFRLPPRHTIPILLHKQAFLI